MFPSPANPTLLRRVAGTIRAFALLEDPELESRITREAALVRAHHPPNGGRPSAVAAPPPPGCNPGGGAAVPYPARVERV